MLLITTLSSTPTLSELVSPDYSFEYMEGVIE